MKASAHYDISQLEKLAGVKAGTLRKWEERYKLLSPQRSAGNARIYNDAQVIRLLNITLLLSEGFKISQIAAMSENTFMNHISSIRQESLKLSSGNHAAWLNQLIAATLTFNEPMFESTVAVAMKQLGILRTIKELFYPFFHKIGWMWLSSEVSPIQEHFACSIVRRKMIAACDALPQPKKLKTFVLFLPPGEWHEISLLLADYLVRANGFKSIYLGQNVPLENMETVIDATNPDFVITFFLARQNEVSATEAIIKLANTFKNPIFLLSSPYVLNDVIEQSKNIRRLQSPEDFELLLNKL